VSHLCCRHRNDTLRRSCCVAKGSAATPAPPARTTVGRRRGADGTHAWTLPRRLDRILPEIHLEGEDEVVVAEPEEEQALPLAA